MSTIDIEESTFSLPGDSVGVQVMGFTNGADAWVIMLYSQLPDDAPLPPAVFTNMPIDETGIDADIKEFTDTCLLEEDETRKKIYQSSFKRGYRFGVYAFSHGLLQILHPLSAEDRYTAMHFFAWELIHLELPEPHDRPGVHIQDAAKKIKSIYQEYQKLA